MRRALFTFGPSFSRRSMASCACSVTASPTRNFPWWSEQVRGSARTIRSFSNNRPPSAPSASQSTSSQSTSSPRPKDMMIAFTCNVCSTRQQKYMSRAAYERGLVIIQCDGCTNRHLIADHLGWMDHRLGRGVDIERILKERGETVHRVDIGKALGDSVAADHVNGDELVPVTRAASAHEARSDACIELLPEDLAAFDDKQGGTGNTSSSKS